MLSAPLLSADLQLMGILSAPLSLSFHSHGFRSHLSSVLSCAWGQHILRRGAPTAEEGGSRIQGEERTRSRLREINEPSGAGARGSDGRSPSGRSSTAFDIATENRLDGHDRLPSPQLSIPNASSLACLLRSQERKPQFQESPTASVAPRRICPRMYAPLVPTLIIPRRLTV